MGYMMPVEREFVSPDFVRLGTKLACAEFSRSGITCFNDMYYFEDSVAEATNEAGLRALVGQTVMKYPAPDASSYEVAIALCDDLIKKWKGHPLIIPAIAPHAVYTTTPEILTELCDMARKYDVPLHFHVAETLSEVENLRNEQGMPVIPYVRKFGMLETKLIAAHCVHVDEGEIRSMQHAGAGIAHNPSSNLKLASGFAPVQRMLELEANVGIGTDGTGSNNDLDMIDEIRLASFVASRFRDPTAMPARQALVRNCIGAKAFAYHEIIGLKKGKRGPDPPRYHPTAQPTRFRRDPRTSTRKSSMQKTTDIKDVMVDGC